VLPLLAAERQDQIDALVRDRIADNGAEDQPQSSANPAPALPADLPSSSIVPVVSHSFLSNQ
jgi:hypothetical protein